MDKLGTYDVIVIGAGHAGIEAAHAAARLGARTAVFTLSLDFIGNMPCNPSIGGTAKGHLVREVDAFDGIIARAADDAAIHHRMPLIIAEADYCRWLDPASSEADLSAMFRPFPEELLTVYPVSNIVNYPAHDQPECLAPLDDTPGIVGLREPDGLGKWGKDGWDEKL